MITSTPSNTCVAQIVQQYTPFTTQNSFAARYKSGWVDHINKNYVTESSNKLRNYAAFKRTFEPENYVFGINRSERRHFSKLRTSSHHLSIETGRYTRPITPREARFCKSCSLGVVGDEKHFLLQCPKFDNERECMFHDLSEFIDINNNYDFKTFLFLIQYMSGDLEVAHNVCLYVKKCLQAT